MKEKHICCICGCEFEGYGNNPSPLVNDEEARCCDECNWKVIEARINQIKDNFGLNIISRSCKNFK